MIWKKIVQLFVYVLFVSPLLLSCVNDEEVTYFDAAWETTTKENAAYYRTQPKYAKAQWSINDYYISGEKQFIGYATDSSGTVLDGIATWYYKSGNVINKVHFMNGKQIGLYAVREGSIGSEERGWKEEDLYYIEEQGEVMDAVGTVTDVIEHYYKDTFKIASHYTSHLGKSNYSFTEYFDKNGDPIGRLDYNSDSEKWSGKEILFYEEQKSGRNEMIAIKRMTTYAEGFVTHSAYYDGEKKIIAQGIFKKNKPFKGTFFDQSCANYKIATYNNGDLLKETTYDVEDYKIGDVTFKNNEPFTGAYYGCNNVKNYKEGKLHGESIEYFSFQGAQNYESAFTYKNGIKNGDYSIYEADQYILEKGHYKNGQLIDEVFYYHNSDIREGGEEEISNNYYLRMNVKERQNKPFISEISQFSTDDNELLEIYDLEINNTDTFSYLDNGYHSLHKEDINHDGFVDLKITYNNYFHILETKTYYVFNPESKKYKHLPLLDNTDVKVTISEKNIHSITSDAIEDDTKLSTTYQFEADQLIKKYVIEEVYHQELDTTIRTQVFPLPVNRYPLLNNDLPPLAFVQGDNVQQIKNMNEEVTLKKEPFSITFPGFFKTESIGFTTKITASYNKEVFDAAIVGQNLEETIPFNKFSAFAYRSNDPIFILDESGHNVLYYDNSPYGNLTYIKNIDDDVILLGCEIDSIDTQTGEIALSEINTPIYMVIFIDKNENLRIDTNEINYITLILE